MRRRRIRTPLGAPGQRVIPPTTSVPNQQPTTVDECTSPCPRCPCPCRAGSASRWRGRGRQLRSGTARGGSGRFPKREPRAGEAECPRRRRRPRSRPRRLRHPSPRYRRCAETTTSNCAAGAAGGRDHGQQAGGEARRAWAECYS